MKPWVMRYRLCTDTKDNVLHYHESQESALRDACFQIILRFDQMDREGNEEMALEFLSLVERGDYELALQRYQKAIDDDGWDEVFEVVQESLLTSGDIPLLAEVQKAQVFWSKEPDAEEGDEDEDESEDRDDDGD